MDTTRLIAFLVLLTGSSFTTADWERMPATNYEFYYDRDSVTWYGARAECIKQGGDLASIHFQNETDFIDTIITFPATKVWIGLNKLNGPFSWIDGSTNTSYTSWGSKEPTDDYIGKLCVFMDDKKWFTSNCGLANAGVLCRRAVNVTVTPTPTAPPTPAPGYCPSGYTDTGTKCYKLFSGDTAVTWDKALTACRSQPGVKPDLASIHSHMDNAFITMQMQPKSPPLWIGARRVTYPTWAWTDNSDTDFKGTMGSSSGSCIAMIASRPDVPGTWDWQGCSEKRGYVCQTHKDPNNVIPTPGPTPSHPCTDGFTAYHNGCYRLSSDAVSWSQAEAACNSQDSHLVAVHSEQENAAVLLLSGGEDTWLGLKKGASGEWEWSNGEYVLYTRWKDSSAPGRGDCVLQKAEGGTWIGADCDRKLPYVCKQSTGPALTTPAQIEGKCPPEGGWIPHGSYCYLFVVRHVSSWFDAINACLTHYYKANLVSIHHVVDNDWIYQQMKKSQSGQLLTSNMFIGMHRSQQDGSMRWVDGSAVQFTHWAPGSPGQKACAVMSKSHQSMWIDYACDTSAGYICKAPKVPLPTRPTDGPGHCPSAEWETYGSACFLYRPDEFSKWYEAQNLCLNEGGYLASVLTEHENDFLHKQMLSHTHLPTNRSYWVGASRINSTSVFGWLGGASMTFRHWGKGFPKADGGDCVQVDPTTAVWRNGDCQQRLGVLCRYNKVVIATEGPPPKPAVGLSGGAIAGVVLGVIVVLCMLVLAAAYVIHLQRQPTPPPNFNNPLSHSISRNSTTPGQDNPAGPTSRANP